MNKIKLLGLASALLIPSVFLVACGNDKVEEVVEVQKLKESLAKQGYVITSIESYGENVNVVHLENEMVSFVGTVDDDFNWLMEPTDKYKELVFHEGLAAVSIPEEREMILASDPNAELWGFIDGKGEWVIQPIYRNVHHFADGVAIVKTIEEDRDDFMNSRLIVISKEGKEIGELKSPHIHTDRTTEGEEAAFYTGGYAYANSGFYDKKGKFTPMELDLEDYIVFNDKRFENDGLKNAKVYTKSLSGDVLNTFKAEEDVVRIMDAASVKEDTLEHMIQNNVLLISGEEIQYLVDASNMSLLLRGKIETGLGDGLLFVEDVKNTDGANDGTKTGTFFDYNGKKVTTVKNMVGPLLEDRYFSLGSEYYTLISTDGEVLIDESERITEVETIDYDTRDKHEYKTVTKIKFREDANDTDPNDGLLNVKTLKIVEPDQLLEHQFEDND